MAGWRRPPRQPAASFSNRLAGWMPRLPELTGDQLHSAWKQRQSVPHRSDALVANIEVTVQGRSIRIGQLWRTADLSNPSSKGHYKSYLESCDRALQRFNEGFQPLIQPLINKASELLARFSDPDFTLGAASQPVAYDRDSRLFRNTELILSVHRSGTHIQDHHNILNEARLSAIGLAVYLAGLLITVPGTSQFPKLLVLDDVLIGLDMANRIPVLKILEDYFADWQIILLTHTGSGTRWCKWR